MGTRSHSNRCKALELPFEPDAARLFAPWSGHPWALFLDSCANTGGGGRGRYDILVRAPRVTLETRGPTTLIRNRASVEASAEDPFELVRRRLPPAVPTDPDLPFCGGVAGYFGYDLARRIERLPKIAERTLDLPDMAVGIYDWALIVDHVKGRTWIAGRVGEARLKALRQAVLEKRHTTRHCPQPFRVSGSLTRSLDAQAYTDAFRRVQDYIVAGDCYQVNLACRFSVAARGDAWTAYALLRQLNPAPFSAYLCLPDVRILSSSPERFLRVRAGAVETHPIKGTAPRGATPVEDRERAAALALSPKDRAENLMIVDLLRNDLGRTCALGSIGVPELFRVESFSRVHHLVSTVTGQLDSRQDALSLLRGCFPGGSVTGAPKIRAMEIIEELERERRGIYCGAIGYLGFDGNMDTNITIRTLVHTQDRLTFWAGGGLVADSRLDEEAEEIEHKAAALLALVERFRSERGSG